MSGGASLWIKDYSDYYIMKFYKDFVTNKNNVEQDLLCDVNYVTIIGYDNEFVEKSDEEDTMTICGDLSWD